VNIQFSVLLYRSASETLLMLEVAYEEIAGLQISQTISVLTLMLWFLLHDHAHSHRPLLFKKRLANHNVTTLEHSPYFLDLLPSQVSLSSRLKSVLNDLFANAKEYTIKATRTLPKVSKSVSRSVIYSCVVNHLDELFSSHFCFCLSSIIRPMSIQ
jgi:hypothetical protein